MRIGVLTSGGDCPGLNAVIRALVRKVERVHHGEVIARGTPEEVVRDKAVLECYLGEETEV